MLVKCDNYDLLSQALTILYSRDSIATFKGFSLDLEYMFAIAWYDFRVVSSEVKNLQDLYLSMNQDPKSFFECIPVLEESQMITILSNYIFKFIDDEYDILYISFNLSQVQGVDFLQQVAIQLSTFGDLYSFQPLDKLLNAYQCRYFDIRKAFQVRQLESIRVGTSSVTVSGTTVELCEHSNECPLLFLNGTPVTIGDEIINVSITPNEWARYRNLKHRRLASLPFRSYDIPLQNKIDLSKIQDGTDTRTTIMVRNIPNKISFKQFKQVVDEVCQGDYEFLCKYEPKKKKSLFCILTYEDLRFDFQNHCNVGYAFISFAKPLFIVKFYSAVQGKKWIRFHSEKVCQLAYAKIQGTINLIQKFQYSKVMLQDPSYRPKLYYSSGPLKGCEMPFPTGNSGFISKEM